MVEEDREELMSCKGALQEGQASSMGWEVGAKHRC